MILAHPHLVKRGMHGKSYARNWRWGGSWGINYRVWSRSWEGSIDDKVSRR